MPIAVAVAVAAACETVVVVCEYSADWRKLVQKAVQTAVWASAILPAIQATSAMRFAAVVGAGTPQVHVAGHWMDSGTKKRPFSPAVRTEAPQWVYRRQIAGGGPFLLAATLFNCRFEKKLNSIKNLLIC